MRLRTHPILHVAAWLSVSFMVASCSSPDSRAQAALSQYQSAAAANDLFGARRALLQLVQAKDDVADYWAELGKVQAEMGSYGDAYYAFTRAYELDRSNPEFVRAVTELALRSGDIGSAQSHAQELEVLVPGDPWVKLVKGWSAYGELRYDEALATADQMLASTPGDLSATILKARSLVALHREDEAVDLLTKQAQTQPNAAPSLALLAKIFQRADNWPKVLQFAERVDAVTPADQQNAFLLIEAALRSGNIGEARKMSFRLLRPDAAPGLVTSVLELWSDYWPSNQRVDDARKLAAASAGHDQRLIYAAFLSRFGSPADAVRLAAPMATLPINAESAEANAVLGEALSRTRNLAGAKARLDAVLSYDPGNATALRGRSELELRTGNAAASVIDAQKLVTVLPSSGEDRLLLARAFTAAGNRQWAERTLWSAFQDIPGDDNIFYALKATKNGNVEAISDLQAEFERQRDAKLERGLL